MSALTKPYHRSGGMVPMSNRGIQAQDSMTRNAAERASARHLNAILRYGAKHGLPNMSHLQCLSELRTLCMVREEELELADKLEAELQQPSTLRERPWW